MKIDPTSFITSSNIAWKGVDVMKGSMYPHYDYELVCNLWLCDYNGGTAFYKYKGHTSINDIDIPDYRKPNEPTVPGLVITIVPDLPTLSAPKLLNEITLVALFAVIL